MHFDKWLGPVPVVPEPYRSKPRLSARSRAAFAELAVLWAFHDAGWSGVWVDMFGGGRYLHDVPGTPEITLDPQAAMVLAAISPGAKLPVPGTWDLFCWHGNVFLFAEIKHHDSITESQLWFREAALASVLTHDAFLLIEWDYPSPASPQLRLPDL
jgi:hypothetical protein